MNRFISNYFNKIAFCGIYIYLVCFGWLSIVGIRKNSIYLLVKNNKILVFLLFFLKNSIFLQGRQMMDIYGVDLLGLKQLNSGRFSIKYNILSLFYNIRIVAICILNLYETIQSSGKVFLSSEWLEREVWDMFGILFRDHSDLRRILTDYGFLGHPLRKDFPLCGFMEVSYDDRLKSVVVDYVELMQMFRQFTLKETAW